MTRTDFRAVYPYFVEYVDEYGVKCSDTWSAECLNEELRKGEVTILSVTNMKEIETE